MSLGRGERPLGFLEAAILLEVAIIHPLFLNGLAQVEVAT